MSLDAATQRDRVVRAQSTFWYFLQSEGV